MRELRVEETVTFPGPVSSLLGDKQTGYSPVLFHSQCVGGAGSPGLKSQLYHLLCNLDHAFDCSPEETGMFLRIRWKECAWHIVSTEDMFVLFLVRLEIFSLSCLLLMVSI